jgi:hypothetical protein
MVGSAMQHINSVLAITYLLHRLELLEQSTWIEISLVNQSPTQCPILQIKYGYAPRRTNESPMSSLTEKSPQGKPYSVGSLIVEALRILTIAMSLLLQKAITTLDRLTSHYWRTK